MNSNNTLASPELSAASIMACLEEFTRARVLIIGDVMMDEYLTGDADRISPEAPVPVIRIESEKQLVGGAGNVARNITSLGGKATLVGIRGGDSAGRRLERCLHEDRVIFSLLSLNSRPTTIKTRILARQQQVLRFDRETPDPLDEQDTRALLGLIAEHLPDCSAVVISDYGKGVVSKLLMEELSRLIQESGRDLPVLIDPKPENFLLYQGVTILTPNTKETGESVHMPVHSKEEIIKAGREIMHRLNCRHLLTTLGGSGMALFEDADTIWHIPTSAKQVFDVTGAGDTVISVLALGLAAGQPLLHSCLLANYAAGVVIGQVGAATVTPSQLTEVASTLSNPNITRWTTN